MARESCEGCIHYRRFTRTMNACHYILDTHTPKGCCAEDCTHWKSSGNIIVVDGFCQEHLVPVRWVSGKLEVIEEERICSRKIST